MRELLLLLLLLIIRGEVMTNELETRQIANIH